MVRFIAVDDNGKITGTVAKPAIEAVAKPLVDAAEARLTPKPILKTAAIQAAKGDGAADGPTGQMLRMVVTLTPKVTRWRLRIRNAGATAQGSGTLTSVGIYHAPTSPTNPAFYASTPARAVPDFTISGTTEFVSPWVDATTFQLGSGASYSIAFNFKGATSTVMGATTIPIYTAPETVSAQNQSAAPTLASRVPLAVTLEYEAEYAQGAVAQGGIVQLTKAEYLAAKAAGSLESGIFYAVTEGS